MNQIGQVKSEMTTMKNEIKGEIIQIKEQLSKFNKWNMYNKLLLKIKAC